MQFVGSVFGNAEQPGNENERTGDKEKFVPTPLMGENDHATTTVKSALSVR